MLDDNITNEEIEKGVGLMAYRKFLWAVKYAMKDIEDLEEYKKQVLGDIDVRINNKKKVLDIIRGKIQSAMSQDPGIKTNKKGGKTLSLPDVGVASLSAVEDKVIIEDEKAIMALLGESFIEQKPKLKVKEAKEHLLKSLKLKGNSYIYTDTGETTNSVRIVREPTFKLKINK